MFNLDLLFDKININSDCANHVKSLIESNKYERYVQQYYKNKYTLFDLIQVRNDWRQWFLGFYCYIAQYAYKDFKNRYPNINEDIFFDTLKDISLWSESCKKKYGYWGIEKIQWVSHAIDLNVFRLGRLQFRLRALEKDYNIDDWLINHKKMVIAVHVPAGEKLDYEGCIKSMKQAYSFFVGVEPIFYCRSWLIDKRIVPFLRNDSNILKFQKLFTVVEQEDNIYCEEFVFNVFSDDKSSYPEDTSLQRNLKKYLLSGGKLGTSTGFFFFDGSK